MAKPFYIQYGEVVPSARRRAPHLGRVRLAPARSVSPEHTNRPSQQHLNPPFTDAGTGITGHAKRSQFVKPGLIDAGTSLTGHAKRPQFVKPGITSHAERSQFVKPSLIDAGTSLTGHAKRPQFVKPGITGHAERPQFVKPSLIDAGYSEHFSQSETPSQVRVEASPPYARIRSTLATITEQYVILLQVLLAGYRTTWIFYVISGLLIPIGFAFFIAALGGAGNPEKAIYLLGGNMALSITIAPTSFLVTKIGSARQSKEFHYWNALPVAKLLLVLAIVSVALVFALPGLLGLYVFGSLLLGLPFEASSWLLLPLTPLGVLSLAGLGALLGLFAKSGEEANLFSSLLTVFVGILSPILVPLESLPPPLRIVSQFLPTTYVADAFRAVLGRYPGTNLALDILILALFAAVLLTITYFRLGWRNS